MTTSSIIKDENTFGDDIDVQDVQFDEELVCYLVDVRIHEVQVSDVKILHDDNNDSKSLFEVVREFLNNSH